jgi:hypothetical protein
MRSTIATFAMVGKITLNQNLTDEQRLERLTQLCDELQAAVAGES